MRHSKLAGGLSNIVLWYLPCVFVFLLSCVMSWDREAGWVVFYTSLPFAFFLVGSVFARQASHIGQLEERLRSLETNAKPSVA